MVGGANNSKEALEFFGYTFSKTSWMNGAIQ